MNIGDLISDATKSQVVGNFNARVAVGTHTLAIRGTAGSPSTAPDARGVGGLFNSVDSIPIELTVLDPCPFTVINLDNSFAIPRKIGVPLGKTKLDLALSGPSDAVSR